MEAETPVYLSESTKIELLVGRWYAWPHLLSPVTRALNVAFRQIPALESYLAHSEVHEASMLDPSAIGGPFVQIPVRQRADVQRLLDRTKSECAHLVKFSEDLRDFTASLLAKAKGQCLDDQYAALPDSLAGISELTYDTSDRPQISVIEELAAEALDCETAYEVSLYSGADEDRRFFLNTPRLGDGKRLDMRMRFDDERLDEIARLRTEPRPFGEVMELLGASQENAALVAQLVQTVAPRRKAGGEPPSVATVRYFGHACVLVECADGNILFDPVVPLDRRSESQLSFADLPEKIDVVFITHNHQDHFCPELLVQIRRRIGLVIVPRSAAGNAADPSMKLALKSLGFSNVVEAAPMERFAFGSYAVTALPFFGEHAGLSIQSKQGALLEMGGRRVLFLADSDCCDRRLYSRMRQKLGRIDALFVGMECEGAPLSWLYGPYLNFEVKRSFDETRRLSGSNAERAWSIVQEIDPSQVYVYAMGQESWLRHLLGLEYDDTSVQIIESNAFVARCRQHGVPAERLKGSREFCL
jgi:L-ascorbate metabolism protein UlaG (beta-lactamase superfamily)